MPEQVKRPNPWRGRRRRRRKKKNRMIMSISLITHYTYYFHVILGLYMLVV
jgi:hypothetical protein